jgi:hypothetical protein
MRSAFRTLLVSSAVLATAVAAPASAQVWRDSLTAQLRREITATSTSSDLMRLTQTGTLMVFQKAGVSSKPGSEGFILESHYRGGQIQQPRGLSALLGGSTNMRQWNAGDKVYVNRIDVGRDGATLRVALVSPDLTPITVNGNSRTARYAGSLMFDFAPNFLTTATAADVINAIGAVLKTESAASAPASISLGQTPEQVEAGMGKPQTVINLGARVIYVYATMRVIFQDGKVSDVQ